MTRTCAWSMLLRVGRDMNCTQCREAVLCEQAELLGQTWATKWVQTMQNEGRPVSGGWPGTLPEARMGAQEHLARALRLRKMPPLTQEELARATTLVYERARNEWLLTAHRGQDAITPMRNPSRATVRSPKNMTAKSAS